MIWNPGRERLSRKEFEDIQLRQLKWTVKRAYDNVPFYRKRFDEIGLKPRHIETLKDIIGYTGTDLDTIFAVISVFIVLYFISTLFSILTSIFRRKA